MDKNTYKIANWIKRNWKAISLIFFGIALFIGNVCVLLYVNAEVQSAWLTLFSGWVSGIATIILGIVAVVQNKKHKDENDRYLAEQRKLNDSYIRDQKDLEWRKMKSSILQITLNEFIGVYEQFKTDCDIKTNLLEVAYGKGNEELLKNYYIVTSKFQDAGLKIIFILKYAPQYFEWFEELYEKVAIYNEQCLKLFDEIKARAGELEDIRDLILEKLDKLNVLTNSFYEIVNELPIYELVIENDILDIFEKDINFLKMYYKNLDEQKQNWKIKLKKIEENKS